MFDNFFNASEGQSNITDIEITLLSRPSYSFEILSKTGYSIFLKIINASRMIDVSTVCLILTLKRRAKFII